MLRKTWFGIKKEIKKCRNILAKLYQLNYLITSFLKTSENIMAYTIL